MKTCSKCGERLELEDFPRKSERRDGRASFCKRCCRNDCKDYYKVNKGTLKQTRVKITQETRRKILEYLKNHPCVDCGHTDVRVLEFDHVRGNKKFNIGAKVHSMSTDIIFAEIAKCDVRCANCHRIKTSIERGWYDGSALEGSP